MAENTLLSKVLGLQEKFDSLQEQLASPDVISDMKKYVQLNKQYKDRIQAMEEEGEVTYWEVIFESRDFTDFLDRMNDAWAVNEDTFFRLVEVSNDDIAKPILGRTETVTYGADGNPLTTTDTHTDTEEREATTDHIDVPVDGSVGNPTYKDVATSKVKSGTIVDSHTQTGVVKTEMSDLGVRPNYESLNGFLDNNRTLLKVFFGIFEGCFTLAQSMRW